MLDIQMLINEGYAKIEEGFLIWNEEKEYNGKFENVQYLAINKSIMIYSNTILIWTFPVEVFRSFNEVYILTYMFKAQEQCYYYAMHQMDFTYYYANYINNEYIIQKNDENYLQMEKDIKHKLKQLITIYNDDKLNSIGDNFYSLSSTWYNKEENEELVIKLKNNISNYFLNINKSKSNELLWTTFKKQQCKLKGKGYTKGFIPINIRATNDYSERFNLAYTVNIFSKPIIKQFFNSKGVQVDQENFALSELIQWIWRSRVRKNEPINLYIPSERMRSLLINWLSD